MGSNLEDILKQGIAVHREGKLQEAETFYRAILKSQPMHPDANHNLGVLAVNVGKVAEALPYFKIALEENPNIEQYWVSYIEVLFQLGQVAEARQKLSQGARFGLTHGKIREIEKRLNNQLPITKAININAHIDENQLRQLISMYQNGNLKQALTLANNLKKKFTNNVTLENIIGSIHFASGNYDEAVNTYENLKQVAPNLPEIHYNLANALTGLEKYKEAKENYYKAIELRPDYADAYNNLGINYATCNEHDKAIVNFKKALGLKGDFSQAYSNLAKSYNKVSEFNESFVSVQKALSLQPDYIQAYRHFSTLLEEASNYRESIRNYKKILMLLGSMQANVDIETRLLYLSRNKSRYEDLKLEYFIMTKDWGQSKETLLLCCSQNLSALGEYKLVFLNSWIRFCYTLVNERDLSTLVTIISELYFKADKDEKFRVLARFIFQKISYDELLSFASPNEAVVIRVMQYEYSIIHSGTPELANELEKIVTQVAQFTMHKETREFEIFLIKRCLQLFEQQEKALNNLNRIIPSLMD